jgi:serine/threonine-protein kinase
VAASELQRGLLFAERFRLEAQLGEGGAGVVWAATEVATGAEVALKFMKRDAADDGSLGQRFAREARAAMAIRHPNVVRVHEVLSTDERPLVIVMERCHGESLAARLGRERQILPALLAEWMLQVVSALAAAHAMGIVHRDLKPENIFLTDAANGALAVKVLDFGLAKLTALEGAAAQSAGITQTGTMLGTPYYMSPEQVYGERDVDHRTDIWALGVVSYECLSGIRPTEAANVGQIFKRITRHDIVSLGQTAPSLSAAWTTLVDRMLASEKSARPTLDEIASVLNGFKNTAPVASTSLTTGAAWARSSGSRSRARSAVAIALASSAAIGAVVAIGTRYLSATSYAVPGAPSSAAREPVPAPTRPSASEMSTRIAAADAAPEPSTVVSDASTDKVRKKAAMRPSAPAPAAPPSRDDAKKRGLDLFSDPL